MSNLYELTKYIETLAGAEHVNNIYEGDVYEINKNQDTKYPAFVITETQHSGNGTDTMTYGYSLFFIDRLLEDKSNELEIKDWAKRAIENVITNISVSNTGYVKDNYTITTFTERFESLCAGAFSQIRVEVPVDNCDLPHIVTSVNGKTGDVIIETGDYIRLKTINNETLRGSGNFNLTTTEDFNNYKKQQNTKNTQLDSQIEEINDNIDDLDEQKVSKNNVKTINGQSILGTGNITVTGESYITSVTTDFDVIDGQLSLYKAIAINSFSGGSNNEIGSTITSVNLTWSLNKNPETQTLTDATISATDRSANLTGLSLTANKTYTLTVTDSRGAIATKSVNVTFSPRKYYGVSSKDIFSNEDVLGLANKPLATSTPTSLTNYDCTGGKYVWFCIPDSWTEPKFYVGGLPNSDFEKYSLSVTNVSGYTQTYKLYRSSNIQTGVLSIEVK